MKSDEQVLQELAAAVAGLWFMSESDYPFEVFRWDGSVEVTPQFLRQISGQRPDAPVAVKSVDEFFSSAMPEASWKVDEEMATAGRYKSLRQTLEENLADMRIYKLGEINMPVYIVGKSDAGSWIGLSTRAVET